MTDSMGRYLPDIECEKIGALLRAHGFPEAEVERVARWLIETTALCRLAFAALVHTAELVPPSAVPLSAIISQTQQGLPKGRPPTAAWAFWAGYFARRELPKIWGRPPTFEFLARLLEILLRPRRVTPSEVRTVFVKLRREAKQHATAAAETAMDYNLRRSLPEKAFADMITALEEDLLPDSQMPPMVRNGKVSREWVQAVLKTRRTILRLVHQRGALGGVEPVVLVNDVAKILGGAALGGFPEPGGAIHLGKGREVPVPGIPAQGGTISISFSRSFVEKEPFAAFLYAVPAWWFCWRACFTVVPKEVSLPAQQKPLPSSKNPKRARRRTS